MNTKTGLDVPYGVHLDVAVLVLHKTNTSYLQGKQFVDNDMVINSVSDCLSV